MSKRSTRPAVRTLSLCGLATVLVGAACGSSKEPGRGLAGVGGAADPWAAPAGDRGTTSSGASGTSSTSTDADGGLGGLGGGDLQQLLGNVVENLKKPGPYEAPAQGPGASADAPHWGVIDLAGGLSELESFSWTGGASGEPVRERMAFLRALGQRPNLQGLIIRFDGYAGSIPDTIELRTALLELRAAGKAVHCHAEGAAGTSYLLMSACDRLGLAPLGEVAIAGPAAMPVHLRPLLARLGVQADFLHVGAYKGAAEPLTRDAPSKEMVETLGAILDRHHLTMVEVIADGRKLGADAVRGLIDLGLFTAEEAVTAKLADVVASFEEFRTAAAGDAWMNLDDDDTGPASVQQMVKLMQFVGAVPVARPSAPHVALVYAVGDVVDGDGDGVLGARAEIASGTLVPALRTLAADSAVKAVVLRIDSGGGSAQASELIWRAVAEVVAKKPVVVSMSDVAASGGYYIAAGATKIYAMADTLTGSIGVVGGKMAIAGALDKVGIKTYPMGRGKRATMMASLGPWSADERAVVQASMRAVYDVFVGRVAAGRKLAVAQVEPIAQGRVWTGAEAKRLGLVDELGGLDAAVAAAQSLGAVGPDAPLEVYPPTPTLRDLVSSIGAVDVGALGASTGWMAGVEAVLAALPAPVRAEVRTLLAALGSFERTKIQTRAFLPVVTW